MAQVIVDDTHLKSIADKIRESTGSDDTYTPSQMPQGVEEVRAAGEQVGKQTAYDEFWDDFQNKGGGMACAYIFYGGNNWSMDIYKPKYTFYPSYSAASMFQGATWLTDTLVPFNFTDSTFTNASLLFYGCTNLVTVNKIISKKGINWASAFVNCKKLKNITFAPKSIKKSNLITLPFNEAFVRVEYASGNYYYLGEGIYDAYSEYFTPDLFGGGSSYRITTLVFESGERIEDVHRYEDGLTLYLPDWFIPEDETQNVSFYLENPSRECIGNSINFSACPLSKESIINIFKSLCTDVTGMTLTLNKIAVNTAFGIDVDDESTWNGDYMMLVYSRDNWTISYA